MSGRILGLSPWLVVAALAAGCSRSQAAPASATSAGSAGSSPVAMAAASAASAGAKTFGAACVEDAECAAAVCFHKRLKTGQSGPEHRGGNDPVERDGYCSMRCDDDSQCPVPPSSGRCGARGMCKRPE
jgi:hypothetical protein